MSSVSFPPQNVARKILYIVESIVKMYHDGAEATETRHTLGMAAGGRSHLPKVQKPVPV